MLIKVYFAKPFCIVLNNRNNITVLTRPLFHDLVKFNLKPIFLYSLKNSLILIISIEPYCELLDMGLQKVFIGSVLIAKNMSQS